MTRPEPARRDVAIAIRQIADPRFRRLADSPALRFGARSRRRGDGKCTRRRKSGRRRLHFRPDARLAPEKPPAQGPRPRGARRLRRAGRRLAGVLPQGSPKRTSGCAGTFPARSRRSRRRRRRTCSSRRSTSATASSATRWCRRSSGCGANIPSSRSRKSRSRSSRSRKRDAISTSCRSTTTSSARRS